MKANPGKKKQACASRSTGTPVAHTNVDDALACIQPDAAGIDIGSEEHYVAVPADRDPEPVRSFGAFTGDLYRLADWLTACGIKTVAMESTGVYWIALYQILESRGFEVRLVNARHVKNVSGRKTDVIDYQWLQRLHSYGLLAGSFRPAEEVCVLRTFLRQRARLVEDASRQIQLLQKALEQMNLLLHRAVTDITGVTGMKILSAIVAGEHDPATLASFRDPRIKSSAAQIAQALTGDYRPEHLFCLKQALETYRFFLRQIEDCDREVAAKLQECASRVDLEKNPLPVLKVAQKRQKSDKRGNTLLREELYRWSGVDLTQVDGIDVQTAQVVLTEIGPDLTRFPTEKHFVSYLALSPNNRVSGGKPLRRRGRPSTNRAGDALRMSALSLKRSATALGAFFRRLQTRTGTAVAVKATARKLAIIIYGMLKYGKAYLDMGQNYYEERYQERLLKSLQRRAEELGHRLVPQPQTT